MERYIRSRGKSKDYHWLNIANDGQESQEDPPISELTSLIKSENFSVVLARSKGQLTLLVTGLNTKSRTDIHTRPIRNSVAWVGDNSDEATLRMLAVQSLKGLLTEKIDSVVTSGKDRSFQIDHKKLKELETVASKENVGNSPADLKRKIGKISEKLKNELADELKRQCLPSTDGPLVVVTEIKKRETLENAKVWRGLSTLLVNDIDEFQEEWQEIDRGGSIVLYNPDNPRAEEVKNIPDNLKNFFNNLDLKKFLGLSIIIIIVVGLLLAWSRLELGQVAINPTPTSISFPTATPNPQISLTSITPIPTVSPPSSKNKICTASISADEKSIDLKVETFNIEGKTMYVQMFAVDNNNTKVEKYGLEQKKIESPNWGNKFENLNGGQELSFDNYYIFGSVKQIDTTDKYLKDKISGFKGSCKETQRTERDFCFVCITTPK